MTAMDDDDLPRGRPLSRGDALGVLGATGATLFFLGCSRSGDARGTERRSFSGAVHIHFKARSPAGTRSAHAFTSQLVLNVTPAAEGYAAAFDIALR